MSSQAQGNQNYILEPINQSGTFQQGKVTIVIKEDITGTDSLSGAQALDFQWNYFSKTGMWFQTIFEPSFSSAPYYGDEIQQWAVKFPYQTSNDYQVSTLGVGNRWGEAITKGSVIEMSWLARVVGYPQIEDWNYRITQPNGVSDGWVLDPITLFPLDWISNLDLELDYNTEDGSQNVSGTASEHVFSITGTDGGSMFTAKTGAGIIAYSGVKPDPIGNLGEQTAESSNFKYSPLTQDDFGNWLQTFKL